MNGPLKSIYPFTSGPSICLEITTSKSMIVASSLSFAPSFTLKIKGSPSQNLHHQILRWAHQYCNHTTYNSLPLDLNSLTSFRQKILLTLASLPFAETISYKGLAEMSGFPKAYRAAGTCCNLNPFPLLIPCHRVIKSNCSLGDYAYGAKMKSLILDFENKKGL